MATLKKTYSHVVRGDHGFTYKLHYPICGFNLEINVNPVSELEFGTVIWDGALGLCQYFDEHKINFSQKKVIELGAGTGMLGILIALLGAEVTITDKPNLLRQIQQNVSVNIPSSDIPRVKVRALSWGHDHIQFPSDYDVIMGTDIVYIPESVPLILKTLQHLSNERTVIYLASTMSICPKVIASGYGALSEHFDSNLVHKYIDKDVHVYRLTRKNITRGDRHGGGHVIRSTAAHTLNA